MVIYLVGAPPIITFFARGLSTVGKMNGASGEERNVPLIYWSWSCNSAKLQTLLLYLHGSEQRINH